MFSVDKRRRERIRAKRQARQEQETEETADRPWQEEGHVAAAPGRQARVRRRRARRQRPRENDHLDDNTIQERYRWLAFLRDQTIKRPSLRQRRAARRHEDHAPEERVRPRGMVWVSWRWLSTTISAFLIAILYLLWNNPSFRVDAISVGGERYLTPEQVFEATDIANQRIFELDAQKIETHLESNPSIADAQVRIGWPNTVSVFITEREPQLIWEQGNLSVWVDIKGVVMFQRELREDLPRVTYPEAGLSPLGAGDTIDPNIIAGALELYEISQNPVLQRQILQGEPRLSRIDVFLYDPVKGLGFREEGNWMAWFGTGSDMERKLQIYDAIVRANSPMISFLEVDVSDPDYPTFIDRYAER